LSARRTGELRAVAQRSTTGVAALGGEAVEFVGEILACDRSGDQDAEAFASVLVEDGGDLDRAAVGRGVEMEVHGPHLVRRVRDRQRRRGARAQALAATPLRHAQTFLTPEPLDFLWFTAQPSPRAS
jgi:hypothetical protein